MSKKVTYYEHTMDKLLNHDLEVISVTSVVDAYSWVLRTMRMFSSYIKDRRKDRRAVRLHFVKKEIERLTRIAGNLHTQSIEARKSLSKRGMNRPNWPLEVEHEWVKIHKKLRRLEKKRYRLEHLLIDPKATGQ
ncbi:MAG: hypothetical protein OXH34_01715 [Bacteroidetes bacterium]|nr:hypothetical protein [Bacteroidota bacterium]